MSNATTLISNHSIKRFCEKQQRLAKLSLETIDALHVPSSITCQIPEARDRISVS